MYLSRALTFALLAVITAACQDAGRVVTPARSGTGPTHTAGQRMTVTTDIGRAVNDVAFWSGTPPDDILVVVGRDVREEVARGFGRAADQRFELPHNGRVTLEGTIEPMPYAEGTYSWGLTRPDFQRLSAKGVYLRLHAITNTPTEDLSGTAQGR
jgi:hypothetical protein